MVGKYTAVPEVLGIWECHLRYLSAKCCHCLTAKFEDSYLVQQVLENWVYVVHCSAYLTLCKLDTFYKNVSLFFIQIKLSYRIV